MLIEFSVSNFKSIRERQTLSMVAAPRLQKRENVFLPAVIGEKLPPLLKVVAIYGPNASGKSNLVRALGVIQRFTLLTPEAKFKPLPVVPFRFDPNLANEPSRFEIHFIQGGQRYSFELVANKERVVQERLVAYPKGRETLLYSRKYEDGSDQYVFGEVLEGGGALHDVWTNLTGPQVLFLVQAVANSNEELKQLRIPFSWLSKSMFATEHSMGSFVSAAERLIARTDWYGSKVVSLLKEVDIPISAIKSKSPDNNKSEVNITGSFKEKMETVLTHETALGKADFNLDEESEGTKNLIGFSLPWFLVGAATEPFEENSTATSLSSGGVLVVDEIDSSLHPKIVESLIARFLKKKDAAQLIFSTHDTHLMDSKLLRRDQYWLTERDCNGATQLRSIHDFEGREGEDIEKRYYEGRYRSLPLLSGR